MNNSSMITPGELMTKFANKHSYDTWNELMYDSHPYIQIEYTTRIMLIYARISTNNSNITDDVLIDMLNDMYDIGYQYGNYKAYITMEELIIKNKNKWKKF